MLIIDPLAVSFGGEAWEGVTAVAIDRDTVKQVLEFSDLGPHAVFADAPEQRVDITVTMELVRSVPDSPRPGNMAELRIGVRPGGSDANRREVVAQAVVLSVAHAISGKKGATRTIRLVAISTTGVDDPVAVV